ncbi:MAG: Asp-tRNA(Asn)/Glu-tRNA(Gln) amidotransferase subunit GatC [Holosporaceae bacterium]|jgi:aspartyl-tRNA(Asn)/glutamyl-tRNA(Gln) amidotransferase subunit C|nr:Asp-tRNA(Asn)/Glu-tRNA(Gln) amidotransferase subunit GatC [Holosporaceae bacterium]
MLTNSDLEKVLKLSCLKLDDNGRVTFLEKLNHIFSWIDQLSEIDVSGINLDTLYTTETTLEREDSSAMPNTKTELLSNSKFKKFDMYCVPKVVE